MEIIAKPFKLSGPDFSSFFSFPFDTPNALLLAKKAIQSREYPRHALATILKAYNFSIKNLDAKTEASCEALKEAHSHCVMTGQQLGLMGGPLYTVLKAISCLVLARETGGIPIFWLATEDHDVEEINHTYLIDELGNLKRFHITFPKTGRCIEDLRLSEKNRREIFTFLEFSGLSKEDFEIFPSYAQTMASFLAKIFKGTGLIFLEPYLLRPLAKDFFLKEINEREKIQELIKSSSENLLQAGGKVLLPADEINLFLKSKNQIREKIHCTSTSFIAGSEEYSLSALLNLAEKSPELFSTNAAARVVLQSVLFPVSAYVAGPSEYAYYQQLKNYHLFHNTSMPCIVPRISGTFVPPLAASILAKTKLTPWGTLPKHWQELFPEIVEENALLEKNWLEDGIHAFHEKIQERILKRQIKNASKKIVKEAIRQKLHHEHLPSLGLHYLNNLFFPHQKKQERVLNWFAFDKYNCQSLLKFLLEKSSEPFSWRSNHFYYFI